MLEGFKLGIYNHSRKKLTYLISIVINGYVSCCWNFWMNFYNNILWCIMGKLGNFWNESNEYEIVQSILKSTNQCFLLFNFLKRFEMNWKWHLNGFIHTFYDRQFCLWLHGMNFRLVGEIIMSKWPLWLYNSFMKSLVTQKYFVQCESSYWVMKN
jgi:hypothetical protein